MKCKLTQNLEVTGSAKFMQQMADNARKNLCNTLNGAGSSCTSPLQCHCCFAGQGWKMVVRSQEGPLCLPLHAARPLRSPQHSAWWRGQHQAPHQQRLQHASLPPGLLHCQVPQLAAGRYWRPLRLQHKREPQQIEAEQADLSIRAQSCNPAWPQGVWLLIDAAAAKVERAPQRLSTTTRTMKGFSAT